MIKKVLLILVILLLGLQGAALAAEPAGDVVFTDAVYGAAIGGLVGLAVYLIDNNNFGVKFGAGVLAGTLGGVIYGLSETRSVVEVQEGKVKVAMPALNIRKTGDGVLYSANLIKVGF